MKIAISGAQSTGKTTLINRLRELYPEYIYKTEITRELANKGFKINENGTDETQLAIIDSHIDRLNIDSDIVYDRCILDGVVYTHYLFDTGKVSQVTLAKAQEAFLKYIISYDVTCYIKPEFEIVDDGERSINTEFRDAIVELFNWYINTYNLDVVILKGSVQDRVNQINEIINDLRSK